MLYRFTSPPSFESTAALSLQSVSAALTRMELVDVENGWQVWGEEYNEKISDMHKLQGTVTKGVSEKMRLKFKGEQQHRIFRPLSY